MWATWIVAAIALAAATFMLRFLVALLREGAPSVCCWVVPVRRGSQSETLGAARENYVDDEFRASACGRMEGYLEFLEKENYAKEECGSGLIAIDVCPASASMGWGSSYSRRGNLFHERRL
jgi:hypothetical protein